MADDDPNDDNNGGGNRFKETVYWAAFIEFIIFIVVIGLWSIKYRNAAKVVRSFTYFIVIPCLMIAYSFACYNKDNKYTTIPLVILGLIWVHLTIQLFLYITGRHKTPFEKGTIFGIIYVALVTIIELVVLIKTILYKPPDKPKPPDKTPPINDADEKKNQGGSSKPPKKKPQKKPEKKPDQSGDGSERVDDDQDTTQPNINGSPENEPRREPLQPLPDYNRLAKASSEPVNLPHEPKPIRKPIKPKKTTTFIDSPTNKNTIDDIEFRASPKYITAKFRPNRSDPAISSWPEYRIIATKKTRVAGIISKYIKFVNLYHHNREAVAKETNPPKYEEKYLFTKIHNKKILKDHDKVVGPNDKIFFSRKNSNIDYEYPAVVFLEDFLTDQEKEKENAIFEITIVLDIEKAPKREIHRWPTKPSYQYEAMRPTAIITIGPLQSKLKLYKDWPTLIDTRRLSRTIDQEVEEYLIAVNRWFHNLKLESSSNESDEKLLFQTLNKDKNDDPVWNRLQDDVIIKINEFKKRQKLYSNDNLKLEDILTDQQKKQNKGEARIQLQIHIKQKAS